MNFQNNIAVSKTVIISAFMVAGAGTAYVAYQYYRSSKRNKLLNLQVRSLSHRLSKLECEVLKIRHDLEQQVSSSDEEFVDASDAVESPSQVGSKNVLIEPPSTRQRRYSVSSKLKETLFALDDKIEKGGLKNLAAAYDELSRLAFVHANDYNVFWRLARAAFLLDCEECMDNPNAPPERHRELIDKAKMAADKAVLYNNDSAAAHKWMAIVLGTITKELPMKNQIENAYVMKKHIDKAIEQDPDDSIMYHMKGRWCYSVYMLTWVERKLAATLFGNPPTATLQEATQCFEKAEELAPLSSMDNLLYLGKVYIAGSQYKKAANCLVAGEKLICTRPDDVKSLIEIQTLLKQYRKYHDGSK